MLDKCGKSTPEMRCMVMNKAMLAVAAVVFAASASAQDQGVPFKVQPVADQVVNGVLVRGARMPVWADNSGRTAARAASVANERNQEELNELARIGRPDVRPTDGRMQAPMAPPQNAARTYPQAPEIARIDQGSNSSVPPSATIKRKARSDDEELADLERAVTQAEVDLKRKRVQIEDRKKDEARRAEEARIAAEREASRKLLVFQIQKGQNLSEAIAAYVGQNGWENLEWAVGEELVVNYNYSERPAPNEGMKEVLLKVLRPYGLSATLHRPNSVVEVFPAPESKSRN